MSSFLFNPDQVRALIWDVELTLMIGKKRVLKGKGVASLVPVDYRVLFGSASWSNLSRDLRSFVIHLAFIFNLFITPLI